MNFKKTLICSAMALHFGMAVTAASAATVTSWHLEDFDGDGLSSDFAFYATPTGNGSSQFAAGSGDGATFATNGSAVATCSVDPAGCVSTGFNFFGIDTFEPEIQAGGVLTFTALNFGGQSGVTTFITSPDDIVGGVSSTVTDLGGGNFGVVIRYIGTLPDTTGAGFDGFQVNWRLEGVMSTVPVPAASWLFGSGLIGLLAGAARRSRKPET